MIHLTAYSLLFTIASIGISEVAYLIRKRRAAEAPVCPIGGGCETVLKSKYNKFFGLVHNDILGMAFYICAAAVSALVVINEQNDELVKSLIDVLSIMLAGATAMSLVFTYLQWRVIRAWCFWCLMSAATIVIMDIIVISIKI